jgi:hypothetical protein
MNIEDLMTGDWVNCTYPSINKCLRVAEIKTVADDELKVVLFDDVRLVFQEKYIKPIPLTPEILEKNGFSRNGLDIALFDRRGGDDFVGASNLQYVHELQHALKLCGIGKEIQP